MALTLFKSTWIKGKGKMLKVLAMKIIHWVTHRTSGLSNGLHFLNRAKMCSYTRKNDCPSNPRSPKEAPKFLPFFLFILVTNLWAFDLPVQLSFPIFDKSLPVGKDNIFLIRWGISEIYGAPLASLRRKPLDRIRILRNILDLFNSFFLTLRVG